MDWEDQLCSLWDLLAEHGSAALEKRIRDLLKERATDEWLRHCGQTLRDGQLDKAKSSLTCFLRDHPDLPYIRKKLEIILLFERHKSASSLTQKSRRRELLLQSVHSLVSSGKLVAAGDLLEEALAENEDSELLDLLGRIFMLQRRPQQAAAVMQGALLARRQQIAFLDRPQQVDHSSEADNEDVTSDDLNYLASNASALAGLDVTSSWQNGGVEFAESQPDESRSVDPGPSLGTSNGNDTVSFSVSAPVAKDPRIPFAEGRKTLSLRMLRKSVDMAVSPQGAKVLVRHAPHFRVDSTLATPASPTEKSLSVVPSYHGGALESTAVTASEEQCAISEGFYCESDINELVGGSEPDDRDNLESLLEESAFTQLDYYEPETDLFDSDHILLEQIELDLDVAFEPATDAGDIEDEYAAYAFDPDDVYDRLDSAISDAALPDGSVSREDRALQKSVELISRAGWSLAMLPLVQQIFVMSGWGATRVALEREIDRGMTPEELILAAHVKVLWAENDYYWIAYDRSGSSNLSQHVMSWPTALLLVRAFESLPQIEELEQFIESIFEYWYDRPSLRRSFRSFNRFIWFRMSNLHGCLPANQPFSFGSPHEMPVEEYSDLGVNDPLEIERTAQLRAFGVFQTKHPQEPGCYFSDKPLPQQDYSAASEKKPSDGAREDESAESIAMMPTPILSRPAPRNLEEHLAMFSLPTEKDATFDA